MSETGSETRPTGLLESPHTWHDVRLEQLAAETERPAVDRLRAYFELLLEIAEQTPAEERGCLLALLSLEKSVTSEELRGGLLEAFGRWQERVAELVRQAQAQGAIEPALPAERIAWLLLQGWEGALIRARLERDTAPLADFLELGFPRLLA